jgi:Flp pilus assembly protein TadB
MQISDESPLCPHCKYQLRIATPSEKMMSAAEKGVKWLQMFALSGVVLGGLLWFGVPAWISIAVAGVLGLCICVSENL